LGFVQVRKSREATPKQLIDDALRRGLAEMTRGTKPRRIVRTRSVALGRLRLASINNVAEVLAIAEGEAFK
jgi:hypothetical protein